MLRTPPVQLLLASCLTALAILSALSLQSVSAATVERDLKSPIDLRLLTTQTDGAQTHIEWSWRDKNRDEDGFLVEVKHNDGEWLEVPNEFPPADQPTLIRFSLTTGDTYYFHVRAFTGQGQSRVFSNYSDTLTIIAGTTQPTPTGKHPDLTVPTMSISARPGTYQGQKVVFLKLSITVKNIGSADAKKTYAGIYISQDSVLDPSDTGPVKKTVPALTIEKAKKRERELVFDLPLSPEQYQAVRGQHLIVVADFDNRLLELSESNNSIEAQIP